LFGPALDNEVVVVLSTIRMFICSYFEVLSAALATSRQMMSFWRKMYLTERFKKKSGHDLV
jgi:hypothetical protein